MRRLKRPISLLIPAFHNTNHGSYRSLSDAPKEYLKPGSLTEASKEHLKLSTSSFWNAQYQSAQARETEWYVPSGTAASFVQRIMRKRKLLKCNRMNVVLEIGCGTNPVVLPLIKLLHEWGCPLVFGFASDSSEVCIAELNKEWEKRSDQSEKQLELGIMLKLKELEESEPQLQHRIRKTYRSPPILRSDDDSDHRSYLSGGVMSKVLEIADLYSFVQTLNYFPAPPNDTYNISNMKKNNVIIIDKGCIDALVWDKRHDLIETVVESEVGGIISLSGEDPDVRLDSFKINHKKLFSLDVLNGDDDREILFGYSIRK